MPRCTNRTNLVDMKIVFCENFALNNQLENVYDENR
jgi:hypothetical protein